jgi:hypothetical protein
MANESGIRIELGETGTSDDNKIILPDGRDIMDELLPKSVAIRAEAGKPTKCTIVTEVTRRTAVDLMPDHVLVCALGDGPETKDILAEIHALVKILLRNVDEAMLASTPLESFNDALHAVLDLIVRYQMQFGGIPETETIDLEGSKNG